MGRQIEDMYIIVHMYQYLNHHMNLYCSELCSYLLKNRHIHLLCIILHMFLLLMIWNFLRDKWKRIHLNHDLQKNLMNSR